MVCRCMCRSVVDESEERTEQVFVHGGRGAWVGERVEGGRGGGGEGDEEKVRGWGSRTNE